MYKKLIVPLDGSETADRILPYARFISVGMGADLELVQVVPTATDLMRSLSLDVDLDDEAIASGYAPLTIERLADTQAKVRAAAAERLNGLASLLALTGVSACVEVLEGEPAEAILRKAESSADAVVAMSTHGRSGIPRWALGSVTDKVVRHSTRPVMVVRGKGTPLTEVVALHRVILPLDGSLFAEAALPHAGAVAASLDLPVTLVRAGIPDGEAPPWFGYGDVDPPTFSPMMENAARSYLESAADRLQSIGVASVTVLLAAEDPADAILDLVSEGDDTLVVMSSHGRSGMSRWTLGSVTDRIIRHSPGPVLVVRPDAEHDRS